MNDLKLKAKDLHKNVPPDWYARSIKENILQRFWHTRRFEEVGKILSPTAGKILDIGCADGTFTKIIFEKTKPSRIVGIDVLPKSIAYAKRRFARSRRMFFKVADAHNLPFSDESFDAVFCLEVLEHAEDPLRVISEMHRVLKKGGYAVVLIPTENFLFKYIIWPLWTLWRGKIWRGTHLHAMEPKELPAHLVANGFTIEKEKSFLLGMLVVVKAVKRK